MGVPCLASIQAPARAFGKAQTSSTHAVYWSGRLAVTVFLPNF